MFIEPSSQPEVEPEPEPEQKSGDSVVKSDRWDAFFKGNGGK